MNTLNCESSTLINYTKTPALIGLINELGLKG